VKFAEAKRRLDHGDDPGALAKAEKTADREAITVRQLVEEYLARSAKDLRSYREVKRTLERNVVPAWGNRMAKAIKRRDVILLLDGIVDRGAPIQANRTLSWTRRMFNFAVPRDIIEVNPCIGVEAPAKEAERDRILMDDEIVSLWTGLQAADMTEATRLAIKLVLLTAQRPVEAAGAAVAEFNLEQKLWTLPAARTKNDLPHLVPLSPMAAKVVREALKNCAAGSWLFPGATRKTSGAKTGRVEYEAATKPRETAKPMTSHALSKAFLRNEKALGIPVPQPAEKPKPGSREALAARRERRRVAFSPHDLRRTAATRMTELGFTRFMVDRILNHVEPGVGRVYDRYEYLREKRQALEAWAMRLEDIIAGHTARVGMPEI
jgi:integrase